MPSLPLHSPLICNSYCLPMQCFVYRSSRKADTYLYLVEKDDFSSLPAPLLTVFGEPQFSFDFELVPGRKLARESATAVIENLNVRGFHLQMASEDKEVV